MKYIMTASVNNLKTKMFGWGPPALMTWAAVVVPFGCLLSLLALSSSREVTALESDASVAIFMSLGYLQGSYPPVYPPGFAFFISAVRSLGMPLRVGTIILSFIICGLVVFLMLRQFQDFKKRIIASSLFGMFFGSIPTIVFEGDITGNVYFSGLCNLATFALLAVTTESKRISPFFLLAFFAGVAAVSRPDTEILFLTVLAFPAFVAVSATNKKANVIRSILAVSTAVVAMICAQTAIKRFNFANYGVDGVANYLDSRYTDFFAAVAALPSTNTLDRYFLADKSRRELAYSLSPTLNLYRSLIESESGAGAIGFNAGSQFFGKRDIANAFYYWHLDNVFQAAHISLSDYLILLGNSAREIRATASERNLTLSNPHFGVLSREYALWLPHVPAGLKKAYLYSFREREDAVRYGSATPQLVEAYNQAALRRPALLKNGEGVYATPRFTDFYRIIHLFIFYTVVVLVVLDVFAIAAGRIRDSRIKWFFLLMLTAFIARILYYGLLDASFYRATVNYLHPNFILLYFLFPVAAAIAFDAFRRSFSSRPAGVKKVSRN